ncbi:MAG: gamma-glutamyltransferase family protein [Pseudomonadales bacterium]|nr:gamma-glutamyltransferase family protein [Pseudomonadales bacterium]MDG1443295.1 gamma-glutamyltransferase family protein [Pseudomonadales bacterium]
MSLDWNNPYSSSHSPVFAENVVSTSQPLATSAGLAILAAGGNAVDAAIATAICLTVVEPNNNGIGSDAFAIVWDGDRLHGLNASGRSPSGWSPSFFSQYEQMPQQGWNAVTVPGAVSAWTQMSERFGRLPFEKLFESAIAYAAKGYQVGPKTGYYWKFAEKQFKQFPSFNKTFLPDGKAPAIGTRIVLADHAETLHKIATSKGEAFYKGELAELMVADSTRHGGVLSMDDLSSHSADWVDTISTSLGDHELHEIPPNGQGLMALIAIGIVNQLNLSDLSPDCAESIHLQIEATRIAYNIIERELADIASMQIELSSVLDDNFFKQQADSINPSLATVRQTNIGAAPDTVYLTTADESGMMVSMIQSNFRGFGSGIVVPNTGISLQNRGSGFSLESGHPNQVAGNKRPYHTIIPAFVMSNNQPKMSFGVMGGHMQAQGHLQMMVRVIQHGQNPQTASDAPRWYLQEDGTVCIENGFATEVIDSLKARGHTLIENNPEHLFGGAQLIYRLADGYCAGSDHRKEGQAAGF